MAAVTTGTGDCRTSAEAIDVNKDADFDLLVDANRTLIVAHEAWRKVAAGYGTARPAPATPEELDQAQWALDRGERHGLFRYREFVTALRHNRVRIDYTAGCFSSMQVYFIARDGRTVHVDLNEGNHRIEPRSTTVMVTHFTLTEAGNDGLKMIFAEPARLTAIQAELDKLYQRILDTPFNTPTGRCGPDLWPGGFDRFPE